MATKAGLLEDKRVLITGAEPPADLWAKKVTKRDGTT